MEVVTDLANAGDRSQSKLPDRQSEIRVLRDTLTAKTDQEEKEEKKMLDRDPDDVGEGSARGTVRRALKFCTLFWEWWKWRVCNNHHLSFAGYSKVVEVAKVEGLQQLPSQKRDPLNVEFIHCRLI